MKKQELTTIDKIRYLKSRIHKMQDSVRELCYGFDKTRLKALRVYGAVKNEPQTEREKQLAIQLSELVDYLKQMETFSENALSISEQLEFEFDRCSNGEVESENYVS